MDFFFSYDIYYIEKKAYTKYIPTSPESKTERNCNQVLRSNKDRFQQIHLQKVEAINIETRTTVS